MPLNIYLHFSQTLGRVGKVEKTFTEIHQTFNCHKLVLGSMSNLLDLLLLFVHIKEVIRYSTKEDKIEGCWYKLLLL